MAVKYLVIVQFEQKSKIPADRIQNSFAFNCSVGDTTQRAAIVTALTNFYNAVPSGASQAIANNLSPVFATDVAPVCKFYDVTSHLGGSAHGSPVDTISWGAMLGTPGSNALPSEVSICLSYRGDYGTDTEFGVGARPRARDRGRLFLGPWSTGAIVTDTVTKRPTVSSTMRDVIVRAAATLSTPTDPEWCVWSRRSGAFKPVTAGWCDDAFDVQRRRGEKAVARSTF